MTVTTPNPARPATRTVPRAVRIAPVGLEGLLALPEPANGIVLFAHGSGSSRFSPRNTYVAEALQSAGLATLFVEILFVFIIRRRFAGAQGEAVTST